MKTGVIVMTLTATIYRGNCREIYTSRIGFCGEYNKKILTEIGCELKKKYSEQIEVESKIKSVKIDRIVCRVNTRSTECEVILNGK